MRRFSFLIFLLLFTLFSLNCKADSLSYVSDRISDSAPNAQATHIINFTITTPVATSGKIVITPQPGAFFIPSDLDYSDLKFFVNDVEQTLGTTSSSGISGVEVATGSSGYITITLATDLNLNSGDQVEVQIGTGQDKIYNPDTNASYRITIETFDPSDNLLDTGTALIAIVSQ